VGPVPDPLLLRKSGSAGNRTQTSGSAARNSDHRGGPHNRNRIKSRIRRIKRTSEKDKRKQEEEEKQP
jgi:hypothetical protein